jgi:hypothetical protein
MAASITLVFLSGFLYHWVFLMAGKFGWPIEGTLRQGDIKHQERFMRENLDVLARKMGEMQAKMTQLESLSERVSGLAGLHPDSFKIKPGQGGVLISGHSLSMDELAWTLKDLDRVTDQRTDLLTVLESKLFDRKILDMMVPTQSPVVDGVPSSLFGWRLDPFTGNSALHTGLDFQADKGTPIVAAAGGVVVVQTFHPAYGNMVEIDHGNTLVTRYAHASKTVVKVGDLIKRGEVIAEVGSTGRSTGAHLHFEVLVQGIPQDPQKFLMAGRKLAETKQSTPRMSNIASQM